MFSFFFNDTATTEIYTLSLHDAPSDLSGSTPTCTSVTIFLSGISTTETMLSFSLATNRRRLSGCTTNSSGSSPDGSRSEEHTPELQSRQYLVCRLLLEKNKPQSTDPFP